MAWLYATETTIDAALGVCLFTLWGPVFVLSLVFPLLMVDYGKGGIGPANTFFLLAGTQVFGSLYGYCFMKETKGLNDKDKKLIFTPKKYLDESA